MSHVVGNAEYYNKDLLKKIRVDQNTRQIIFPDRPSFRYGFKPGAPEFVDFYKHLSEKKYEAYTSKEVDKKARKKSEREFIIAKQKLELARLDKDEVAEKKWRDKLEELTRL